MRKMVSLFKRPLDLLIVFVFVQFSVIALTIDFTQSIYGPVVQLKEIEQWYWPPPMILKAYAWWCNNVDPLLAHNPVWYETLAWLSPLVYLPFYFFAIYAFLYEKEWIRVPALMWGWGLLITLAATVREELYGAHPTKDTLLFAAAYGGYIVMPVIVMLRVAWTPVFPRKKQE